MKARFHLGPAMILGAALAAGQYPPLPATNSSGAVTRTEPEHKLPTDQSQEAQPHALRRKIDTQQIKRDAADLAKLTGDLPPDVERAGKGMISKDLNDRLKRIEKLAKQLRRELNP